MKYCSNCGKELLENDKFCSGCGNPVEKNFSEATKSNPSTRVSNSNLANKTVKNVSSALLLIGIIGGIFIAVFVATRGEAFGFPLWYYTGAGGKELSMFVGIFAGASFLIGLFMRMSASKK